jgi:hypothetical protein
MFPYQFSSMRSGKFLYNPIIKNACKHLWKQEKIVKPCKRGKFPNELQQVNKSDTPQHKEVKTNWLESIWIMQEKCLKRKFSKKRRINIALLLYKFYKFTECK